MKKIIFGFILSLVLFSFFRTPGFAQTPPSFRVGSPVSSPAAKIEYVLPYPGILPDHLLYPLKMLRDRIMDFFIREPMKRTEFLILMADKRLGAGKILIEGGKAPLGETTLSKGEKYLEQAVATVEKAKQQGKNVSGLLEKLEKATQKHIEVLQELSAKAPEEVKLGIEDALTSAQNAYQKILEVEKRE